MRIGNYRELVNEVRRLSRKVESVKYGPGKGRVRHSRHEMVLEPELSGGGGNRLPWRLVVDMDNDEPFDENNEPKNYKVVPGLLSLVQDRFIGTSQLSQQKIANEVGWYYLRINLEGSLSVSVVYEEHETEEWDDQPYNMYIPLCEIYLHPEYERKIVRQILKSDIVSATLLLV